MGAAAGEYRPPAADRVPVQGDRLARADFLGAPADFPAGPWLIASVLRCPVWGLSCLHEADGYHARISPLAPRVELPRANRQAALDTHAAGFAAWLEQSARRSPYDWFNFYPFWDSATHGRDR